MLKILSFALLVLLLFASCQNDTGNNKNTSSLSADSMKLYTQGESIVMANCIQCHRPNTALVGPALAQSFEARDRSWLKNFINNPAKMIAEGDTASVALLEKYKTMMVAFPQITEADIDAIAVYVSVEANNKK